MIISPLKILTGLLVALFVSIAAQRAKALSRNGAVAAAILGIVIFGLGGLGWAALLLGFFISSSVLSRILPHEKASLNEKFSKDSTRDASQVFANGGIAGILVFVHILVPDIDWPWLSFAGALAAANADTWSTELGVLSPKSPRLITSGNPVERGTSGGVTFTGTMASLGGGLLIALLAIIFWEGSEPATNTGQIAVLLVGISLAGLAGSLLDSLLGATVQAIYHCPACAKETEHHPAHTCGNETMLKRGWSWLNNDWVNTFCTLTGACVGILLGLL
jgi:uncharacterized protein (TIGR00297 family)